MRMRGGGLRSSAAIAANAAVSPAAASAAMPMARAADAMASGGRLVSDGIGTAMRRRATPMALPRAAGAQGRHREPGVVDLMAPEQARARQVQEALPVLIDKAAALLAGHPVLARHVKRRADLLGVPDEHRLRSLGLPADHRGRSPPHH